MKKTLCLLLTLLMLLPYAAAAEAIPTIRDLNTESANGDHAADDFRTASLENNFRETTILTSATTKQSRYDKAFYPRIRKVRDDLYLMVWMYSQYGQHLYYATSADGYSWNAPEVLWNSADYKFTYGDGPLAGTDDRFHAMNPDLCVLDDGSVLCVYAVRAPKGYRDYPDLCGLYIKRAAVGADNKITWSGETRIYTGQVWEPSALRLSTGEIHIYYTQVAPDITEFGYDENHRSTETGLIISTDGGKTFAPYIGPQNANHYRALTIYREYVGDKDGRPHFNGQMPVATELYNGKLFVTVEVKELDGRFHISYGVSDEVGKWKDLAKNEESSYVKMTEPPNSSPYVDRFLSGEVYVTHNYGGGLVGRFLAADGSDYGKTFSNTPGSRGMWGSCAVLGTHRVVTAMQHKVSEEKFGIGLYYAYLNHRINAKKSTPTVDGAFADWKGNTDALFVGSESQAQITLQTAHDNDNLYFLISRLDNYLTASDTVTVNIGVGTAAYYAVTVDLSGKADVTYFVNGKTTAVNLAVKTAVALSGTPDDNRDTDEGCVIEIALPKAALGLAGATAYRVRPELCNVDGGGIVRDTLTGVSSFTTTLWPQVV
ncbi:MAG: hypothetical protein IJU41_09490, partial [Clostridia bacterium]|nr:hypothetical protein [Clostridia bacterium]